MKTYVRSTFLSLQFSLLSACGLWAQALPTATGPGSYLALGGGLSAFQTDYGHNTLGGGFAFADVNPGWRFGLEGEARVLRWHADEQVTEATYVGGLRVALWPKPRAWTPYGKFLAGAGHITLPYGYARGTFLTYAPGAGVDVSLGDRFAVRVIDFEYQHWPQFPFGSLSPYGLSAGVSLRLNPVSHFPKGARGRR